MEKKYYVYILKCSDNSLYTGITINPGRRMKQHISGKGSKYVRSRLPIKQIWFSLSSNKSEALKLEYRIKQLPKNKKIEALNNHYQKQIKKRSKGEKL